MTVKVAILGAGRWGRQHARAWSAREDVQLAGIFSRSSEKAMARAAEFRTRGYTSIRRLLSEERPDFVSICLPDQTHFQPTLEIIQAGLPLLVEKPLAFALPEARTLVEEAARRELFFALNFNHRYARPVIMAQEAIAGGRLGRIDFASWRFGGDGSSTTPYANLIETQCHGFDQLEHLCGPIDSVMAQMTTDTQSLALALHFVSGAVGAMIGSYDSSYAYEKTHQLEINGVRGRILIEDTVRRFSFHARHSDVAEVWQAGFFDDENRSFPHTLDRYLDDLIKAFQAGQPPPVPARAGLRALELAHAAIASFESGARVTVPSPP